MGRLSSNIGIYILDRRIVGLRVRLTRWQFALLVLIILAAVPRLLTYNYSLPYVDYVDEPNLYWKAQAWRGLYDQGGLEGYPPGYILVHIGAELVVGAKGPAGLALTVRALRLIAVGVGLLTLVFIALIARLIAGELAGLIAGIAWGISPLLLQEDILAIADPFVYMFVAAVLWLAVVAICDSKRSHWCIWSVVAGLLAILFKYPVVTALAPGGLVALAIFFRQRRTGFVYLAIQATLILAMALFLVFVYHAQRMVEAGRGMDMAVSRIQQGASFLNPHDIYNNIYYSIYPIEPVAFAVMGGFGLIAYGIAALRGRKHINMWPVLLCVIVLVTIPWIASIFSVVTPNDRIRDVLPATPAACVILGVAVAQITTLMPKIGSAHWLTVGKVLPTAALVILVFVPQGIAVRSIIADRQGEDWRVLLRHWADASLDPGTIIVDHANFRTFNAYYSGIDTHKWFEWWEVPTVTARLPAEWRYGWGFSYVAISKGNWQIMQNTPEGRAYLAQLLPLRSFVAPPTRRGPETLIYRLWRMDVEQQNKFGGQIVFAGYDRSAMTLAPGDSLTLRFYWQATAQPIANYSVYIHLAPLADRTILAQADGAPAAPERPTLTWDDPSETLISSPFQLQVPSTLPPGRYRVLMGLYDYVTGQRLLTENGDNYVQLFVLGVGPSRWQVF